MKLTTRLLRKNMSAGRIAGFILSNFIGLAIVLGGLQFYLDARSIWESDSSFVKSDYLVINKKVTSANTLGEKLDGFSEAEVNELKSQPWVRDVGAFAATDYKVWAKVEQGGRGLSTSMFFESIPDKFVDVAGSQWYFREDMPDVPIIISKDYLTLYNFGFAAGTGMPRMSENIMSGVPLTLKLSSNDGEREMTFQGHIAGYSNRLNTILVPEAFMDYTNRRLGNPGHQLLPQRLIIDVSSPGDVAIGEYLNAHDYELAGDKSGSQASFLLKVVVGIVLAVGIMITLLSFFILLLSISLLMEKNRDKLHALLMLGYDMGSVGRPYAMLAVGASCGALLLAIAGVILLRASYLTPLEGLGASPSPLWISIVSGVVLTLLIIIFNLISIRRKVKKSWRL